jgi:UDP-N-acetylmuramoyl-L-alanyl-D-glutamate--2,6-diaminopimelate ligase
MSTDDDPIHLSALIEQLPIDLVRGSPTQAIKEIVEDSRLASPGCLFVARTGTKADGRRFAADAAANGAVAVLADSVLKLPDDVALLTAPDVPLAAAQLAERFHGHPSRELKLIGITGTNGKTTTAYLIHQLLNGAAIKCGLIGTVQVDDGMDTVASTLTTPPPIELSRLIRNMVNNRCKACVMEASSHALHQKRTAALDFDIGVFTNLTGDHLDYHRTMQAYRDAKALLFEQLPASGFAVVNVDDPAAAHMVRRCSATVIACSLRDRSATCHATIHSQSLRGIEVTMAGPWGSIDCRLPLLGAHNAANALQAMAVCHFMGLSSEALRDGISHCSAPPGRLEPVTSPAEDFAVLVDYAHSDDALENVLRALQPIVNQPGQLRVVFGCGGDRDRTKRPRMAAVACRYAHEVIITSDNPRTEDPQRIIDEICAGVPANCTDRVTCIVERKRAIEEAIQRIQPHDIVLIAGKGHEDYQIVGTTKRPFDDRKVTATALELRHRSGASVHAGMRFA